MSIIYLARTPPQFLRADLPQAACDAILKALSSAAQDRYSSASDFGEAIANAFTDNVSPPQEPPLDQSNKAVIGHLLFTDLVGDSRVPMEQQLLRVLLLTRMPKPNKNVIT